MSAVDNRQKGAAKTSRIPIKIVPAERLRKPDWIRVRFGDSRRFREIKQILREQRLRAGTDFGTNSQSRCTSGPKKRISRNEDVERNGHVEQKQ